jgi:protein TonB
VLSKLPVHVNDEWRPESMQALNEAVHQIDEHLYVAVTQAPSSGIIVRISGPGAPARPMEAAPAAPGSPSVIPVGGRVQNTKLIYQEAPVYPTMAKSARVQGTVELAALIGPDGHIQQLNVVSGHPLLRQAALDAVKQWIYSPTLLNGNPVSVSTTIDVIFSLSQ